jgi:hypothetical protein
MKSMKTLLLKNPLKTALSSVFFGALLLIQTHVAIAIPTTFEANYSVAKGSMTLGNLHTSLKVSGGRYSYHKYTKATGLAAILTGIKITENTDGNISGNNIRPTSYLFNKKQRSKSKIDKLQFSGNSASGSYRGTPYKLTVAGNAQDRASLELVLARDVALNKAKLSYPVVEKGGKKQYTFQKLGNESIKTPAGTFNTVKVKVLRSGNKRETIFWLAKETDYMPVKIHHREKGDLITTVIKNYKKT